VERGGAEDPDEREPGAGAEDEADDRVDEAERRDAQARPRDRPHERRDGVDERRADDGAGERDDPAPALVLVGEDVRREP
jgi:hypothetical protein